MLYVPYLWTLMVMSHSSFAQSAGAVEYTDSAEE